VVAAPAFADSIAVLDISQAVDHPAVGPGDSFTYSITVDCSSAECTNASLTDVLPAQFDALTLDSTVAVTPPEAGASYTSNWSGPNNRTLTVNFTEAGGAHGIAAGDGYTVQVTMSVPAGLSPDFGSNGIARANPASVSADDADTKTSSQDVTVTIPVNVGAGITKAWSPSTAQYKVGAASAVTLTANNASNALATSIVLQDPTNPGTTASAFQDEDFATFGAMTLPAGADEVFVDAFVAGSWVTGTTPETPSTLALPATVTAPEVEGLRFTFESSTGGATLTANGTAGSAVLNLTQRATTRSPVASLVLGATDTNIASSTVVVPGQTPVSKTATATYVVTGLNAKVTATKSFSPSTIAAGSSSVGLVTAANASNGPLASMTITEPTAGDSFFAPLVAFGGFTAASTWPSGATNASIVWSVDSGTAPTSPDFTSGGAGMPATPTLVGGQRITGFTITYTGAIGVGATAGDAFLVNVAGDENTDNAVTVSLTNHALVGGSNDAGTATLAPAMATLSVLAPQIVVTETKTVTPSAAIAAGGHSTVQLPTKVIGTAGYLPPTTITIKDVETGSATDYWNAFNAMGIAPTQVSLGSTLQVNYTTNGTDWIPVGPLQDATGGAFFYNAVLPTPATTVGIEFVFHNSNGFSLGSSVSPAIAFEARSTLRSGGPTATDGSPVTYTNSTTARGDAVIETSTGTEAIFGTSGDTAPGTIKALPGGDNGTILSKAWQIPTAPAGATSTDVVSQANQTRVARILWGTQLDGTSSAEISDPADPTNPADPTLPIASTVFQAFDLTKINAITPTTDPLIAFDEVTGVNLLTWNATTQSSSWTPVGTCTVAAPCAGGYPGFTLSSAQSASTIGVKLTIVPDDALREASTDPLAPAAGSGLASDPVGRPIDLTFTLRNVLRDTTGNTANPWVTASKVYNATDPGLVSNTAYGTYVTTAGTVTGSASDTIDIIDPIPAIASAKSVATAALAIPNPGDVLPKNYPTDSYTLTATNASAGHTWDMRVTDPMPCPTANVAACVNNNSSDGTIKGETINPFASATYDPSTNPFEDFNITSIVPTAPSGGSLGTSSIIFEYYTPATSTTAASTTFSAPILLSSAELTTLKNAAKLTATFDNVVGFSILFASSSTSNGGTITATNGTVLVGTQLRQTSRSTSMLPTPTNLAGPLTVTNNSFTQDYDDVFPDANVYDSKSASVNLTVGTIKVAATKSMALVSGGSTLLEANRNADVAVTLGAASGGSDAASDRVVITDSGQNADDSPAVFWQAFRLKSIGTIAPPLGSNQIEIDAEVDGATTWTTGTPMPFTSPAAPSNALPAGVTASHVTGLRVTFTKTDGSIFSNTAPAAAWTASVPLVADLKPTYLAGQTFTGAIPNAETATSHHPVFGTATMPANATITLGTGTFSVDVVKTPSVATTPAGQFVDWTLQFTNTGTGFLKNPTIVDQLPVDATLSAGGPLLFDPTAVPTYVDSAGGQLAGTPIQSYNATTRQVSFAWPAGSQLAPGEQYQIVLSLQVAPGLLQTYGQVLNKFTFASDQTLASCTNLTGTQGKTLSGKACSTTNFVTVLSASAITTFKGVKGNVDASGNSTSGATNVTSTSSPCTPDSDGFYRTPCAANTVIGGSDLWKLQVVNGGNIPSTGITVADVLPHAGDTLLRASTSRGSTYTPQFAGDVSLITDSLSAGTAMTWQVTDSANACPNYDSDPTCSSATWSTGPDYLAAHSNSYRGVTAVRMQFNFSSLSGGTLPPAATLKVTYETLNAPSQVSGDHGVPTTVPSASSYAWNTFGAYALFGASASRVVEPVKAGVEIATGSIQVNKVVSGASASYAPVAYTMTATCVVDGVQLTLPSSGALSVNSTSTVPYATRLDGLPVGSVCSIVEAASGASAVGYAPANSAGTAGLVTVTTAGSSAVAVPSSQQVTVTNTYGTTNLTITKRVSTTATVGSFGPFAFSMTCTVNNGATLIPVTFADGSTTMTFPLSEDGTNEIDSLPVDAVCSLVETDSDNATSISASIDGGSPVSATQGGPITIPLAAGVNHTAVVTNTYAGGQLAIMKTVSEAGSLGYGSGPFTVTAVCTYQGQTLYDSSATGTDPATSIVGGQTVTLAPVFPVGTSCAVAETDAGGATSSSGPATVLIVGPTGGNTTGITTTTITNTFSEGSLKVTKVVHLANDAIQNYGDASYQATVTCTWVKDGTTLTIPLPNGGIVDLTAENGYTQTITGLIAGASCGVVESETSGATTSVVSAVSPSPIVANGESDVTITNTFDTGSLVIDKDFAGTSEAIARFGQGPTHSYTAAVTCSYLSNGVRVPINLGLNATVALTFANGYSAEIDGLLDGASCSVTETNVGLAVSSSLSPNNGTVTIVDSSEIVPASVAITNTFVVGTLDIVKTASTPLTQGSATYNYTLAVSNTGTIDAPGVEVTDPIDPTLDVTSVDSAGWLTCNVTGADPDGYGGSLDCILGGTLAAGTSAPIITMNVRVLDTISQDEIDNTAMVCSTSTIFDCDTGAADVPVKWIDVTASSVCVKDAPYLQYSINAHNLDVSNHTLTVSWADSNGTFVHADTAPIPSNGVVAGTLLWPGATADSSGNGTGWPGYRLALPGETPDWNGLVLDPSLPSYSLRDNPLITFSINPHRTLTVAYPAASASCNTVQPTDIAVTKTASVSVTKAGVPFTYTIASKDAGLGPVVDAVLTDPIPATLHISNVATVPAAAGMPDWTACTLTGVNPDGGGGTVTCTLDRPLTYGQSAPNVILTASASTSAPIGVISNTATLTGDPPAPSTDAAMIADSTALVLDTKELGITGVMVGGNLIAAIGMLLFGLLFVGVAFLLRRPRRRARHL
jgi:large repetitive protein